MSDHWAALGGTCSARFEPLRELFSAKLASGEDLGASVAVNIAGRAAVRDREALGHALPTAAFERDGRPAYFVMRQLRRTALRARMGRKVHFGDFSGSRPTAQAAHERS